MADCSDNSSYRRMSDERVTPLQNVDRSVVTTESGSTQLALSEVKHFALVQVFAKKNRINELATILSIKATPGEATVNDELTALPLSPGQWLLRSNNSDDNGFRQRIADKIGDLGFASEQSHSRILLRITGSKARELLQKGCRLDLHPSVISKDFCAQTTIAQIGVMLHQTAEKQSYDLYIYSGFARSFWQWIIESAAQYGYDVQ